MTTIGFTGTRQGMTSQQEAAVSELLSAYGSSDQAVHGDCIGADADFDRICKSFSIERFQRPCTFENMRAHTNAVPAGVPKPPMQRNRDIVADLSHPGDFLIACPPNFEEIKQGSGSWATIRFGWKAGKRVVIVYPDGSIYDCEAASRT